MLAFHQSDYQRDAASRLDELVEYLEALAKPSNRLLVISGLAGTGKTHLLTRAARLSKPSVLPIVVHSPDKWKNFGDWLDEKLVAALLPESRIFVLATQLVDHVFGPNAPRVREQLQKDWGTNPYQEAADKIFAAGRNLSLSVGPVGINVGDLVLKILAAPFGSQEDRLRKFATTLSAGLGLGQTRDCTSFCAALLLCQTPNSDEAVHWLTHKTIPECLPSWNAKSSNFSTFRALAIALNKVGVKILLCFDQLERIALDVTDGDTLALRQLLRECIQLVTDYENVGCVVSALQAVYARTYSVLADPERDRIAARPKPIEMQQLTVAGAPAFLAPRIDHVRRVDPALASELDACVSVLSQSSLGALTVPARFFVRSLGEAAEARVRSTDPIDPVGVWGELFGDDEDEPEYRPISGIEVSAVNTVSLKWSDIQGDLLGTAILPRTDAEALSLIGWALGNLPFRAVSKVTIGTRFNDQLGFEVAIQLPNGAQRTKSIFLCNEPNYKGKLVNQLERLKRTRTKNEKVVLRTRDQFPKTRQSPVRKVLDELAAKGFSLADPAKDELLRIAQLRRLSGEVSTSELAEWLTSQLSLAPTVERLLSE